MIGKSFILFTRKYFLPMKQALLLAGTVTLLAASCTKKGKNTTLSSNNWMLGTTAFNAINVKAANDTLVATATNSRPGYIYFIFNGNSLPVAGGSYTVTAAAPAANQVQVLADSCDDITNTYGRRSPFIVQSGTIIVTVNGGKITCILPSSFTSYPLFSGVNTTVAANITQQ